MKRGTHTTEFFGEGFDEATVARRERIMYLGNQIESIERSISLVMQHYASRSGLTLIEAHALATLFDHDGRARVSTIAEHVRMPLSTMTGVAMRLEKSGLVVRERAADDRRASILTLTPQGQETLRSMFTPFFDQISGVIDTAGEETMQSVIDAFDTVAELAESLSARIATPTAD